MCVAREAVWAPFQGSSHGHAVCAFGLSPSGSRDRGPCWTLCACLNRALGGCDPLGARALKTDLAFDVSCPPLFDLPSHVGFFQRTARGGRVRGIGARASPFLDCACALRTALALAIVSLDTAPRGRPCQWSSRAHVQASSEGAGAGLATSAVAEVPASPLSLGTSESSPATARGAASGRPQFFHFAPQRSALYGQRTRGPFSAAFGALPGPDFDGRPSAGHGLRARPADDDPVCRHQFRSGFVSGIRLELSSIALRILLLFSFLKDRTCLQELCERT